MRFKADLHEFLNEHLEAMAESHLEGWADRYKDYCVSDLEYDLEVNHDDSCEIEWAKDELNREMTSEEIRFLCKKFHEKVVNLYRNKIKELLN